MSNKPRWGWVQANGADLVVTYREGVPSPEEFKEKMESFESREDMHEYVAEVLVAFGYDKESAEMVGM